MIDKVVVCGIRRARKLLPASDILQMVGRAGRSFVYSGEATLLVPSDDYQRADDILNKPSPPIDSMMGNIEDVAFHVLPEIAVQRVNDEASFDKWFSRTLAYAQGKVVSWHDVVDCLIGHESICFFRDNVVISPLGSLSATFYYPPSRIKSLRDKLSDVSSSGFAFNSHALSWCFSSMRIQMGGVDEYALSEYRGEVQSMGYFFDGGLLHGYIFYCLLEGLRPKWLRHAINGEWSDFERLVNVCRKIAAIESLDIDDALSVALLACKRRAGMALAGIMMSTGIDNKRLAFEMQELGVRGSDDLDKAMAYGSDDLRNAIKKLRDGGRQ